MIGEDMQRFRIKTPMSKDGLIDIRIVSEIQDVINILKKYKPLSMDYSPRIMFHGSEENFHLLQGSLLISGLDSEVCASNEMLASRGIHTSSFCVYVDQLDY